MILRLLILSLALVATGYAQDRKQVVDYDGGQITGHLRDSSRSPFVITVRSAPFSPARDSSIKSWIGCEGRSPVHCRGKVLVELGLSIGGRAIAIPREAFADLGDPSVPRTVGLMQEGNRVHLYIRGSDGAGSYDVRFTFENMRLTERRINPRDYEGEPPPETITRY